MNVDRHDFEMLLVNMLGLKELASNPDSGATSGTPDIYISSSDHKIHYKDAAGVDHVITLADDSSIASAKVFADATLQLLNAAATFKTTLHTLATAARSVSLPDAAGNILLGVNGLGGMRVLTSVGAAAAGAATLTGAKVGDVVLGISDVTDHTTLLPGTDFEATISVINQIQQLSASNLSAKTIIVFLAANS